MTDYLGLLSSGLGSSTSGLLCALGFIALGATLWLACRCPTLAAPIRDRLDLSKLRVRFAPFRRLSACIQHKEYLSRESLSPDML